MGCGYISECPQTFKPRYCSYVFGCPRDADIRQSFEPQITPQRAAVSFESLPVRVSVSNSDYGHHFPSLGLSYLSNQASTTWLTRTRIYKAIIHLSAPVVRLDIALQATAKCSKPPKPALPMHEKSQLIKLRRFGIAVVSAAHQITLS
jgi:hypothetical protein